VIAFFTFFGWTGVYLLSEGRGLGYTVAVSAISGGIAMSIVAYMIYKFSQLEKSGTINLSHAIDQTGEVYLTIPEKLSGQGKIHVLIDGTLHEMDAQTSGDAIETGQKVRVIDLTEQDIMLVAPLEALDQPTNHSEIN
ncbi:MAG: NfeD family protein, partial [Saprospiraceae bacterium]|nr:NfeD family protein [Saprospiraceae bacterium]